MRTYKHETILASSPASVFAWFAGETAFVQLRPPWVNMDILRHDGITDGGIADLRIWLGKSPVSIRWKLQHEGYIEGRRFMDRQIDGPFKTYLHTHEFADGYSPNTCIVRDLIEYELPLPVPILPSVIDGQFDRLFGYRAEVLKRIFG